MNKKIFLITITALTLIAASASASIMETGDLTREKPHKKHKKSTLKVISSNESSDDEVISDKKETDQDKQDNKLVSDKKETGQDKQNNKPDSDKKETDQDVKKGVFTKITEALSPLENFKKFRKLSMWHQTGIGLTVVGVSSAVIYYLWQKNNNKKLQEEEESNDSN